MTARDIRRAPAASCVDLCVHELFAAQAAAAPGRVAVTGPDAELTYGELDERAERLAARLARSGVERDTAVGVLLERSVDFVVTMLAILKAGGCYVPLDPNYPDARLRLMLDAAGVKTVVTNPALSARVPGGGAAVEVVDCRDRAVAVAAPSGERNHAYDLAYIMFTSGSTGTPKAVAVRHSGVTRLVDDPDYVRLDADVVMANISSVSFDAATFEIWGALANGGRLVVGPPGPTSAAELGRFFREQGVTCAFLTSGLFNLMVDGCLADLGGFRQLLTGGDVVSPRQARRFLEAHPACRLINGYGPTEMTTFTACRTITLEDTRRERIPIGTPIRGTWVEILDEDFRPAPAGTTGMLYAGGPGLARGYLNDTALTAERFVPDPWARGRRLYATQDLAAYLPDGSIDFLGRADAQVKKRGFRVEPGEIEEALRADPLVRQAAVVLTGQAEDAVLVAFLVLGPPAQGDAGVPADPGTGIRERLRDQLPEYLIPDRFVTVGALPLTLNGKVDRHALAGLLDRATAPADGPPEPPAPPATGTGTGTGTEARLAAIWREVLAVPSVGRDDNFFDLGGQSLQASRMVSRMRSVLGVEVPLRLVFDHPTVAELARLIDGAA